MTQQQDPDNLFQRKQQRYRMDDLARFRRIDHESLILNQRTCEILVINDTASRIIERMGSQGCSVMELSDALEGIYDVERQSLERDVLEYMERLHGLGIVVTDT